MAQKVALGFLGLILLGAVLLSLPIASVNGKSSGFITALFTATSSVCVTGLVVVDTGTYWSNFGKIIILLMIQIGGLGFMTVGTFFALLLGKKIKFHNKLLIMEDLNRMQISGVIRFVKYILTMTFVLEGIGAVILAMRFMPIYGAPKAWAYGIFHSISAFCNAGFDLMGNFSSFTGFKDDVIVNMVIMSLIVIGGLGFSVVHEIYTFKKNKKMSLHARLVLKLTGIFIVTGTVLIFLFEYNNGATLGSLNFGEKWMASLFHSITPRTAGFNTLDTSQLTDSSKLLTMIFMFIGGASASTAGGIKITTLGVVVCAVISIIKGKKDTEIGKRRISKAIVDRGIAIIFVAVLWVSITVFILTITEPQATFLEVLFESFSAFGTVGLTLGITTKLSTIGRLVIIVTMFLGRVGLLTIAMALAGKQQGKKALLRYPEEKIIVG